MRTRLLGLLGALAMMVLAATAGTGTASAADGERAAFVAQARDAGLSAAQATGLQERVDGYLAELDGRGTQVAPNQIDLGGAVLNVTAPGEEQPRPLAEGPGSTECRNAGGPPYGWFCAYQYQNRTGDNIGMYTCGRTWIIPWFTVGSWDNNQTTGTRPLLTFTNGSTWSMPPAHSEQLTGVDWSPVLSIRPC